MKSSALGTINWADALKGLFLAVITAVITVIMTSLEAGSLEFEWKKIGTVALITTISYLSKNLMTNSEGKILKSEE
jgi:hypothetical protein